MIVITGLGGWRAGVICWTCAYVCTDVSPHNSRCFFNLLEALASCFCANLSLVLPALSVFLMPHLAYKHTLASNFNHFNQMILQSAAHLTV